jgi:heterodisulfide reductase subunit D
MQNCRFDKFNFLLVDIIEAARAEAVKHGFCPENQKALLDRTIDPNFFNPYGEINSDNMELKKAYNLPDEAEWVYFIGCTSNYRQKSLRDATLRFLKKVNINFTVIDEHCCCSPLIRTGQTYPIKDFVNYNIAQIRKTGATKIITSCAGCYRTIKKDWPKFGAADYTFEIYNTIELIKKLLDEGKIKFLSEYNKTITYHDPCHLGRHMEIYDIPREVIKQIPSINFVEMKRNKQNAWCCGAGGGVKIGFPEWALEISKDRIEEAKETGASLLVSVCPFCKTNLSDANKQFNMDIEILDLIELLDKLEIKTS